MRQGMFGGIFRSNAGKESNPGWPFRNSQFLWNGSENNHGQLYMKRRQFIRQLSAGNPPFRKRDRSAAEVELLIFIGNFAAQVQPEQSVIKPRRASAQAIRSQGKPEEKQRCTSNQELLMAPRWCWAT
jgi:hypothetical protein